MEPLVETDLDRPFMLMTAEFTRAAAPVAQFWSHLNGWRLNIQADGAAHALVLRLPGAGPQLAAGSG